MRRKGLRKYNYFISCQQLVTSRTNQSGSLEQSERSLCSSSKFFEICLQCLSRILNGKLDAISADEIKRELVKANPAREISSGLIL